MRFDWYVLVRNGRGWDPDHVSAPKFHNYLGFVKNKVAAGAVIEWA
jgi:hypothetical protein